MINFMYNFLFEFGLIEIFIEIVLLISVKNEIFCKILILIKRVFS